MQYKVSGIFTDSDSDRHVSVDTIYIVYKRCKSLQVFFFSSSCLSVFLVPNILVQILSVETRDMTAVTGCKDGFEADCPIQSC